MTYPNFDNKHLEEALFGPRDFLKYDGVKKGKFPKKYIILFQKSSEKYIRKKYRLKPIVDIHHSRIYIRKGIGYVRIEGIGAPQTVAVVEELIALGGKEFVIVGTAGGLQDFGVYVCDRAIRDEGTSHHYLPNNKYALPNLFLTKKIAKYFDKKKVKYKRAATWTIDAPYRETKKEIEHYKKEKVATVEMEASAVFAVAQVRKVKAAAVFVVTDVLGEKWNPQFKHKGKLLEDTVDAVSGAISS